ncbi:MAG: hypothetical protein ACLFWM_12560 [Actinomycetota bacterium]
MYKRLTISLVLMGLAAFSLAAGAMAWFSDQGTGEVSISAGSADIVFTLFQDCTGPAIEVDEDPYALTWSGIVPGDETEDCIVVENVGDGDLDLYIHHQGIDGNLRNHVEFTYGTYPAGDQDDVTVHCGPAFPDAPGFIDDRGCEVSSLAEGDSIRIKATAVFLDNGNDQNALEEDGSNPGELALDVEIVGYTG